MDQYGLVQTVGPAQEPVSLADMKTYLHEDQTDNDNLISNMITAAREMVEVESRRCFINQTFQWTFDTFAGYPLPGGQLLLGNQPFPQRLGGGWPWPGASQLLFTPRSPLVSVSLIEYIASTATPVLPYVYTTLPSSAYNVDTASDPGRIAPLYGTVWPTCLGVQNAIRVTFVAGMGTAVPARLTTLMQMMVGAWYKRRDEFESSRKLTVPVWVRHMAGTLDAGRYP